jgi:fumarylacetoacetate (FAA) hydrolase
MRLATRRKSSQPGSRDGELCVVSDTGDRSVSAQGIAPSLQAALDDWARIEPLLRNLAQDLDSGRVQGEPISARELGPPLPRAYEWVDGSAFLNHIELVRKARGADLPEGFRTDPLVYQGGSGVLLGPTDDLVLPDEAWGLDFEAEVCVVLGDVPLGVSTQDAGRYIRLVLLANDVTYRNLVPPELAKGFGFFGSKPATAFSPFALTPDELGDHLRDGRLHLPLRSTYNGVLVGDPNAGPEMHFSFHDLIAHIAKTRAFTAGTILGSGTVSNRDPARGISCLAERRTRETLEHGAPTTPYMKAGDRISIEMLDESGRSLFGTIDQKVVSS